MPGVLAVAMNDVLVVRWGGRAGRPAMGPVPCVFCVRVVQLLAADGVASVPVFHDALPGRFIVCSGSAPTYP
ncbi:hypothetical protein NicSoilB4_01840 [Arthrobacter sp. NicSoilB4]|nr:hypothetical protein NicSoilB4_01840 [Arthrobacter sp. NicSoilB4]